MSDAPVNLDKPKMNLVNHHLLHIKALKARVDDIGLKGALLYAPALNLYPSAEVRADFFSRRTEMNHTGGNNHHLEM